jgi:hypothetical protein
MVTHGQVDDEDICRGSYGFVREHDIDDQSIAKDRQKHEHNVVDKKSDLKFFVCF